jgi:hypothetical protein
MTCHLTLVRHSVAGYGDDCLTMLTLCPVSGHKAARVQSFNTGCPLLLQGRIPVRIHLTELGALGFGDIVSLNGGRPATKGVNRRGLLLLGMMLRDSGVAKQVRRSGLMSS